MRSDSLSFIFDLFGDCVNLTKDMLDTTIEMAQRAIIDESWTTQQQARYHSRL
jgi:hypothetical protein